MAQLLGGNNVRVERGQYKPTLGGSDGLVTKTVTLSNAGQSLDRMRLSWVMGGSWIYSGSSAGVSASNTFLINGTGAGNSATGAVVRAYISAVNQITVVIHENTFSGTPDNYFCYEVERW